MNPLALAITQGATFVARGFALDIAQLAGLLVEALNHRGYALIDVMQPCVSFNRPMGYDWYRERVYKVEEEGHDASDRMAAMAKALRIPRRLGASPSASSIAPKTRPLTKSRCRRCSALAGPPRSRFWRAQRPIWARCCKSSSSLRGGVADMPNFVHVGKLSGTARQVNDWAPGSAASRCWWPTWADEIVAVDEQCTHMECSLLDAPMKEGIIVCPRHLAAVRCSHGQGAARPCHRRSADLERQASRGMISWSRSALSRCSEARRKGSAECDLTRWQIPIK